VSLSALSLVALWPASLGAVLQRSLDASLDAPTEVAARRRVDFAIRAVREETDYTLVEGIAYPALDVPESGEVPGEDAFRIDSYRTWMSPETLRAFAYKFLERGTGGIDSHHDHGTVGAIVESWITREDSAQYPALVWVVTVKVLKETTRQELRDGKLKGFSIEFTGKYREKTLVVTGVGRVRTGEILDPYPLTLSLVKAPAIGILFEGVEARSARDDSGGVTPLWRCDDMTIKTDTQAAAQTPSEPAAAPPLAPTTEARETPAAAPSAEPPTPVTALALRANFAALLGGFRSAQDLGREEVEAFVRQVESRATTDWSSLASVWGACANRWKVRDAMSRALMAAESVFYECAYYGSPTDEEMVRKFRALGVDFGAVVQGVCDEADAAMGVSTRAASTEGDVAEAHQRAGKKLSKATREVLEKARQCASDCGGHLDGLLGEETEESETESETKSARELAELRAALDTARAALATRETELTAARTTETALRTRAETAEKRVGALEAARPAPRAGDPPPEAAATRAPASPLQGVLGLRRFVGRAGTKPAVDAQGDDDGEE